MTQAEFLQREIAWAEDMLKRGDDLPGELTIDKVLAVREAAWDKLIDHAHFTADGQVHYR